MLGGHSDGVSVITFNEDGPGETAIFWSDVVPTAHHVQPPYIMAYDIDVVRSFEQRSEWLERAARGAWIGLLYHDGHMVTSLPYTERRERLEGLKLSGPHWQTPAFHKGDGAALSDLDLDLGTQLLASGIDGLRRLGQLGDAETEVLYDADPYGVQYWVVTWACRS